MPTRWRTATTQVQALSVEACWRPMVGDEAGDFHDVIDLRDGRFAVVVGDAPGYGPAAAEMAERLRSDLRLAFVGTDDPARVFTHVDELMTSDGGVAVASALCLVVDPAERTVRISNAGHPPPVLVGPDGAELIDGHRAQPLLGIPAERRAWTVALPAGAAIYLYTDGIFERRGTPVDDALARMVGLCAGLGGADASAAELARRAGDEFGQPPDDASIVAVRLRPEAVDEVAPPAGGAAGRAARAAGAPAPADTPAAGTPPRVSLRVHVDPSDLRSAGLEAVVAELADRLTGHLTVDVEFVDVTAPDTRTEDAGVLAAPTIVRVLPAPPVRVIGWLRSPEKLARGLQLPLPEEGPSNAR